MDDPAAAAPRATIAARALDFLDWRINPVLLRDLRLYMRGKFMLAAYFLSLAGLILTAALYAVIARYDQLDGVALLRLLTSALAVICGALIPNLAFERFRSELASRAAELALASPLTPARLVRGKLLGAWCMTLMAISAAAPMLATAYLLGGVDLTGLFGSAGGVLLAGLAIPTLQLAMAVDFKGGRGLSRGLAALLFVGEFIIMLSYASLLHQTFVRPPVRPEWNRLLLASLAAAAVLIGQFLYFNTVGILRGEAEDRDVAPRLSLSLAAALGALCAIPIRLYLAGSGAGPASAWIGPRAAGIVVCLVFYAFCLGFTAACQSSPAPAPNLREKWRRRPIRSLLLLPGINSLAAYFLLHAAVLLGGLALVLRFSAGGWDAYAWDFVSAALAAFMSIAYGLAAYYYLVLPLARDKRNPKLLSYTIGLFNIALALAAVFTNVLISYLMGGKDEMYNRILGLTPAGLITACLQRLAPEAGLTGLAASGILALLLVGIAADVRGVAGEGGDHAPR
ncbi:MAG: hypothetical protein LBU23_13690 [Planctomycetota bacterium]|jgi:hypothetical protein|nr:hypothetical protein [Planctomycetota bacterium]